MATKAAVRALARRRVMLTVEIVELEKLVTREVYDVLRRPCPAAEQVVLAA